MERSAVFFLDHKAWRVCTGGIIPARAKHLKPETSRVTQRNAETAFCKVAFSHKSTNEQRETNASSELVQLTNTNCQFYFSN